MNRTRATVRRLLPILLAGLALPCLAAAAASASCESDPPYSPSEGFGLENPGAPALQPTCTGDPINCATGNLVLEHTDAEIGGRGPGLVLTRSYNSQLAAQAAEPGPFGYGWTGPYSARLEIDEEAETATVQHDNGSAAVFYLGESGYQPAPWVQSTLVEEEGDYAYTLPDQSLLEFDGTSGRLIAETDRNGNSIALAYDEEGRLATATDDAERQLVFAYDEADLVESVTDPMENVVEYGYEGGELTSVTLPGEEEPRWEFGYDESHQLTSLTDGRGNTTTTEYDESSRAILQVDAEERERKLEYEAIAGGSETVITEPNGSETVQKFNEAGLLTSVTHAAGTALAATTTKKYDSSLNLTEVTDPNNHTTKFGYDGEGNRTSEKDANGNETKWGYNKTHDVTSITTPEGQTTTIVRDGKGNPEIVKQPAPGEKTQETTFEYAGNGDLENATDPLERTTEYAYDEYGNLESETNPEGEERSWEYNENSVSIAETTPRGNEEGAEPADFTTEIEPDAQGKPLVVTDPLGNDVTYAYDGNGNVETRTDAENHTTTYAYNDVDELVEVEKPDETVVTTAYNAMGQVISRTNGNEETTEYKRDLLGNVIEEVDPLERVTEKEYDPAGNLEEVIDAAERTTTYTYDAGDRLEEIDYSQEASPDVSLEYDKDGNIVAMVDGTGTSEREYDQLGRLVEVENGNEDVIEYGYDLADQLTEITYPNGKSVVREYDGAGRLKEVTDWLEGETKFAYNADSLLETTTFPAGTGNKDEFAHDATGAMTEVTMRKGEETLASIVYERDKVGQVESVVQAGLPGTAELEYGYDQNDRLTQAGATAYEYDAANNPTKIGAGSFAYDEASQLETGPAVAYDFNAVGERIEADPESGPTTTYGYDQAGNLISVDRPEEGELEEIEESYEYDGSGLRVEESGAAGNRQLAWDTSGELPLLLNDDANSYVYGPGGQPILQIDSEENPLYLHHDQLGSTRMLTGASGAKEGAYSFDAYGNLEAHTGSAETPLGFNGQYTNEATGLIYLRARTYDPATAQFMSVDPLVEKTGEPYAYAGNNPVNAADPSGELRLRPLVVRPQPTQPAGGRPLAQAGPQRPLVVQISPQGPRGGFAVSGWGPWGPISYTVMWGPGYLSYGYSGLGIHGAGFWGPNGGGFTHSINGWGGGFIGSGAWSPGGASYGIVGCGLGGSFQGSAYAGPNGGGFSYGASSPSGGYINSGAWSPGGVAYGSVGSGFGGSYNVGGWYIR